MTTPSTVLTVPAPPLDAGNITVSQTLLLLDTDFSHFANGIDNNDYSFWVGSGVSLGKMPGLKLAIQKALKFLHSKIDSQNPNCPFRKAFKEALQLIGSSSADIDNAYASNPLDTWDKFKMCSEQLVNKYSDFLSIEVTGQQLDYLLWDAMDVANTYGDENIEPDATHLSIALLACEGVATDISSANWDGLIEKAFLQICGVRDSLKVCVTGVDLRQSPVQATLIKYHGCAIRAKSDPTIYRPYLVATMGQIDQWHTSPNTQAISIELKALVTRKPSLILGFSAQDHNIRKIFVDATATLGRPWPSDPPACIISDDQLGSTQTTLLKSIYNPNYTAATASDIQKSSLFRAYANQLLTALVLNVIFKKILALATKSVLFNSADNNRITLALKHLRDLIANKATGDLKVFIEFFAGGMTKNLSFFTDGKLESGNNYRPLSTKSIQNMIRDPSVKSLRLFDLSLALGIISEGDLKNQWKIIYDVNDKSATAFHLQGQNSKVPVVFVANDLVLETIAQNRLLPNDNETIFIHGTQIAPYRTRSPNGGIGRTGSIMRYQRNVSISEIIDGANSFDEIISRFDEEVGPI